MFTFLSDDWLKAYSVVLNSDAGWASAAFYFSGNIGFDCEGTKGVLCIKSGCVVEARELEPHENVDILLIGPRTEWQKILDGKTDFFKATSEDAGKLKIEGDVVSSMRNAKVMWLTLKNMASLNDMSAEVISFSPAPAVASTSVVGHYIDVDGVRTYYEEAGDGYPLICFHAACQDSLMYRHVLDGLSDQYRVIAVDAPGHAKSLMPEQGPFTSLTQHSAFNERLIEKLQLDRPIVMGCSMAGNMVLELGARNPNAYAAIISAEGADFTPTISDFMLDMLLLNGQQILECYSQSITGRRTPPDRAKEVVWQLIRAVPEIMKTDLQGYASFDRRDTVGQIQSPVLLIRGCDDWLVSRQQVEETAARILNSKIVELEGTGHYPMIENPVEFNEAVRLFLNQVSCN